MSVPTLQLPDLEAMASTFHRQHKTKKAKAEAAKAALYADPMLSEHEITALSLLGSHPQAEEKIGSGVYAVSTTTAMYGTRCFQITRADGSTTDFSYLKCLTPPSEEQDVRAACREAVRNQIQVFRDAHAHTCDLTGLPLNPREGHVHHAPPMFDQLVQQWADTEGGIHTVYLRLTWPDNHYGGQWPPHIEQSFDMYHRKHARPMLVHPTANLHVEAARRSIAAKQRTRDEPAPW